MKQARIWVIIGTISGFLSVLIGAFGAHGLKPHITKYMMTVFQTGVEYQMFHSMGLIGLGLFGMIKPVKTKWAGWAFTFGILVFSGSLYLIAGTGFRKLGMITPFGGLAFMIGWILFARSAFLLRK